MFLKYWTLIYPFLHKNIWCVHVFNFQSNNSSRFYTFKWTFCCIYVEHCTWSSIFVPQINTWAKCCTLFTHLLLTIFICWNYWHSVLSWGFSIYYSPPKFHTPPCVAPWCVLHLPVSIDVSDFCTYYSHLINHETQ